MSFINYTWREIRRRFEGESHLGPRLQCGDQHHRDTLIRAQMSAGRIIVSERAKSLYSPTMRRSRSKTSILRPNLFGEPVVGNVSSAWLMSVPDVGSSRGRRIVSIPHAPGSAAIVTSPVAVREEVARTVDFYFHGFGVGRPLSRRGVRARFGRRGIDGPLHRRECALIAAASFSAAYRMLTIIEIEVSVSKNGRGGPP